MRLWHKDLIDVLPRKQLLSQWRECCAIASSIANKGTPNHILVNQITLYKYSDFIDYTKLVLSEMKRRGYNISTVSFANFCENASKAEKYFICKDGFDEEYMNKRYLRQCYYNLQEKKDRGGITLEEYTKLKDKVSHIISL